MSYKILFSDIDGTLLDADRTLSQKTIKVLSELPTGEGRYLGYATDCL